MEEKLKKAREDFKIGEIDFMELHDIFNECASESELNRFWSAPVFDRAGVIIGKNQKELDAEWSEITTSK